MDGFELVKEIKRRLELSTATIMMLTSSGQRGDALRCEELGISAYLLKPVRQLELREAIIRVLSAKGRDGPIRLLTRAFSQPGIGVGKTLQILVAEDNLVNQMLMVRMLEKRGHHVDLASNGRQALSALEKGTYDLVLMDVQMPEMDGLEATILIRKRERFTGGHLPVVAMTALVMKGDRERCMEAGMDGYLTKPIRPRELDDVLERFQSRDHEHTPVVETVDGSSLGVSGEELLERINGDRVFLSELLALFRADYPVQICSAREAIARKDASGLQKVGHSLKGALGNLAAPAASRIASDLESMANAGDLSLADARVTELEKELLVVTAALESLSAEAVQ